MAKQRFAASGTDRHITQWTRELGYPSIQRPRADLNDLQPLVLAFHVQRGTPCRSARELVLDLRASRDFAAGELGLMTAAGVVAVDLSQGVAPGCFLVRAVAPVKRGHFGKFAETHHT